LALTLLCFALAGCELVANFDRSKIPQAHADAGKHDAGSKVDAGTAADAAPPADAETLDDGGSPGDAAAEDGGG
jgi:hypothetical protein